MSFRTSKKSPAAGNPPMSRPEPRVLKKSRPEIPALIVTAGMLAMLSLIWPADVPWINDEPLLLGQAWQAVQSGTIPTHGFMGNVGVPYGPVPGLIYMGGLWFSHALPVLVFFRALLFMATVCLAVCWLAKTCGRLNPLIGVLAVISPYTWFYSRLLWDNSFLIPFSALVLAAYTSFSHKRAVWKLWIVGLGMGLMFQTHLMCAPLLAAIGLHFIWQHLTWARVQWKQLLPVLLVCGMSCIPYLNFMAGHLAIRETTRETTVASGVSAWLFPFLGGEFFSAIGLDYFFGDDWQGQVAGVSPILLHAAVAVSAVGIVGFWIGSVAAVRFLAVNGRQTRELPAEFHLLSVACLALGLQVVLNGLTHTGGHPHYYNATWFCVFALLWFAYGLIRNAAWRWGLAGLHGTALLFVLLSLIWNVHRTQGNATIHYGPTLRTQMEVLDQLSLYHPNSKVRNETAHYRLFPHAFNLLQWFHPLRQSTNAPMARLVIRHAEPQAGTGRLIVVEETTRVLSGPTNN